MDGVDSSRSNQIRKWILRHFYERNCTATSKCGKKGAAVKIGDLRRTLKSVHGLSCQEVIANLRYLISQGWVEEINRERIIPTASGGKVNRVTTFYAITALGIDHIEGPGEFTPRNRFEGIVNINASGQSTVTVGDGNQVNAKFIETADVLADFAGAVKACTEIDPSRKMDAIADIDTVQSQLARSNPNGAIIRMAWSAIEPLTRLTALAHFAAKIAIQLGQFIA